MDEKVMACDISVGVYEKGFPEELSIPEMLSITADAGFDFFELSIDRTEQRIGRLVDPLFMNSMSKAISQYNLPVDSLTLSAIGTYPLGSQNEEIASHGMEIARQAISFAKDMGVRIIQVPAYDVSKGADHNSLTHSLFIDNMKRIVEIASKHAIVVGLENMEDEYSDTIEKCMGIIDAIDSPYFQLYPDSGNSTNAFRNDISKVREDMAYGKGHYLAYHLKEVREGKYGGLYYGDGIVQFSKLAKEAYKLGARRFTMEYWYTGNSDWKNDVFKANRMCREWLE